MTVPANIQQSISIANNMILNRTYTDFNGFLDDVYDMALLSDQRILVLGTAGNLNSDGDNVGLVRYLSNGSIDSSFGTQGKLNLNLASVYDTARALAVTTDNHYIIAGSLGAIFTGDADFFIAKLDQSGQLDTGFAGTGWVRTEFGVLESAAYDVAEQADGKYVVAGWADVFGEGEDFALVRYLSDGTLDSSFGNNGKVVTDFASANEFAYIQDRAYSLLVQSDQRLILGGYSDTNGKTDFALARYMPDGSLDMSFGANGKVTLDFSDSYDRLNKLALQADGKIIAVGSKDNQQVAIARFNLDGSLDNTFGNDGKVLLNMTFGNEIGKAVTFTSEGKILVAADASANNTKLVVYKLNQNGSLDTSFDNDGYVVLENNSTYSSLASIGVQPNGDMILAGQNGNDFMTTAIRSNGSQAAYYGTTTFTDSDVANPELSGQYYIDALLDEGPGWNFQTGQGNVLYYTFDINLTLGSDSVNRNSITAFNQTQRQVCLAQLNYISSVTGIQFVATSDTTAADLHFMNGDITLDSAVSGLTSWSYEYSLNFDNSISAYDAVAFIYLDNNEWASENTNPSAGTWGYEVLLHEIGHALGLKHPFEGTQTLPTAEDNTSNTIMSYTSSGSPKTTFSAYDLSALDWIYGRDGLAGDFGMASANKVITGTSQANTITGTNGIDHIRGMAGADSLSGGLGDDVIDGGSGIDMMTGGDGNDVYIVDATGDRVTETNANASTGGSDRVKSFISYTLGQNVEHLMLIGTAAINGTGNGLNNILTGNAAANTLNGDAGGDSMTGGDGNDVYIVDHIGDRVSETNANATTGGSDRVKSFISYTLGQNVEHLMLIGTAAINGTGNGLNNILTGNAAANTLNGDAGGDSMTGGDGNDVYIVDHIGDRVTETNANATTGGSDRVKSFISYTLGQNVEHLMLIGTAGINGTGNSLNNILTGNAAANTLNGDAGGDRIIGGGGKDTLTGGLGADTFVFTASTETAVGASRDVITDFSAVQGDKIDLSLIDANTTLTDNQAFSSSILTGGVFTQVGQLMFQSGILSGNTDSNFATAEFEIALSGITLLQPASLVL